MSADGPADGLIALAVVGRGLAEEVGVHLGLVSDEVDVAEVEGVVGVGLGEAAGGYEGLVGAGGPVAGYAEGDVGARVAVEGAVGGVGGVGERDAATEDVGGVGGDVLPVSGGAEVSKHGELAGEGLAGLVDGGAEVGAGGGAREFLEIFEGAAGGLVFGGGWGQFGHVRVQVSMRVGGGLASLTVLQNAASSLMDRYTKICDSYTRVIPDADQYRD